MSLLSGSAESVVLPVPERPKKSATSSLSPMFAEQCIGKTPCSVGRTKLRTLKMLFLISPAYPEPAMSTTLREKSIPTKVSESVPSSSGSARKPGTESTVHSGSKSSSSSFVGRRKSWRAKRACHAYSVATCTLRRYLGSAPA